MRTWKTNLFQAIFLFVAIVCLVIIYSYFIAYQHASGNSVFLSVGLLVIDFLFGGILGWERFSKESNRPGKWLINLPRLVLIGLPSLVCSNVLLLHDADIPVISGMIPGFLTQNSIFASFSQILFGYILLTSFYKTDGGPAD
jgi:uncharacterized transporter YbjL